jgi:hypothetical protein
MYSVPERNVRPVTAGISRRLRLCELCKTGRWMTNTSATAKSSSSSHHRASGTTRSGPDSGTYEIVRAAAAAAITRVSSHTGAATTNHGDRSTGST